MIAFDFHADCCGCGACENSCPTGAIQMLPGKDGFRYPKVNTSACVSCTRCEQVCPHLNAAAFRRSGHTVPGSWLYCSENDEAKRRSASGAAFFELAKGFVQQGGYVCGCVWTPDLKAVHIVGSTMQDIERMQGSKYLQSDPAHCYADVLKLLRSGHKVLFSGTPCQAMAMHGVVLREDNGKYRDHLLTAAVLCHGVASPAAWESFKSWTEAEKGSRLASVNFRDKSREGYRKSYCRYEYSSGEVTYSPTYLPTSKYIEATLVYNLALRHSCSHCDCKGATEGCDLVLGDWYAEHSGAGALGTSCLVAFTSRGQNAATALLSGLREIPYRTIVEQNGYIENSVHLGEKRDEFLSIMNDPSIWNNVERLYPPKYKYKKLLVRLHLYEFLKRFI